MLFDRHAAVLHRYAARRLGPDHAEDVVAEVFTRAFETRHRYEFGCAEALPWLYGITTNVIGLHRRAEVDVPVRDHRQGAAAAPDGRRYSPEGLDDSNRARPGSTTRMPVWVERNHPVAGGVGDHRAQGDEPGRTRVRQQGGPAGTGAGDRDGTPDGAVVCVTRAYAVG